MTTSHFFTTLWTILIIPFFIGPGCAHDLKKKTPVKEEYKVKGWTLQLTHACYLYVKKGEFQKYFQIFEGDGSLCTFVKNKKFKPKTFKLDKNNVAILFSYTKPRITKNLCHLRYRGMVIDKHKISLQKPPLFKYSSCPKKTGVSNRHWNDIKNALAHGLVDSVNLPKKE